jgi:hypothetical protein
MTRLLLLTFACLSIALASAEEFSCPDGLSVKSGIVPHPWFDDVPIPSKWCTDKNGVKNGPWWGWDPETNTVVFRVRTVAGEPHGIYRMYYTTGAVAEEGELAHGKRVGKWVVYKEDGTVESEENY